jgi:hypothetical protein
MQSEYQGCSDFSASLNAYFGKGKNEIFYSAIDVPRATRVYFIAHGTTWHLADPAIHSLTVKSFFYIIIFNFFGSNYHGRKLHHQLQHQR